MKTIGLFLILSAGILVGGCYTQFAATIDEPETFVEAPAPVIIEPVVPVLILEPTIYLPPPVYYPLPVGASLAPGAGSQKPAESTTREIGNHRTDSRTRTSGSRR